MEDLLYISKTILIISALLYLSGSVVFKGKQSSKLKWQLTFHFIIILALTFNAVVLFYSNWLPFIGCSFILLTQILVFLSKLKNFPTEA